MVIWWFDLFWLWAANFVAHKDYGVSQERRCNATPCSAHVNTRKCSGHMMKWNRSTRSSEWAEQLAKMHRCMEWIHCDIAACIQNAHKRTDWNGSDSSIRRLSVELSVYSCVCVCVCIAILEVVVAVVVGGGIAAELARVHTLYRRPRCGFVRHSSVYAKGILWKFNIRL